jgi:hypothetical protein
VGPASDAMPIIDTTEKASPEPPRPTQTHALPWVILALSVATACVMGRLVLLNAVIQPETTAERIARTTPAPKRVVHKVARPTVARAAPVAPPEPVLVKPAPHIELILGKYCVGSPTGDMAAADVDAVYERYAPEYFPALVSSETVPAEYDPDVKRLGLLLDLASDHFRDGTRKMSLLAVISGASVQLQGCKVTSEKLLEWTLRMAENEPPGTKRDFEKAINEVSYAYVVFCEEKIEQRAK